MQLLFVEEPETEARVHVAGAPPIVGLLNVPVDGLLDHASVPVGFDGVVVEVSVTVAVQVVEKAGAMRTGLGVHATVVVVVCSVTAVIETVVVPVLTSCVVSPP